MARQKRVFNSAQTCHVWASQSQEDGRNTAGNIFFEGTEIFSYGSHFLMAKIWPENESIVLVQRENYSNTTAKHKGHVYRAASHLKSFSVSDPADPHKSIEDLGNRVIEELFDLFCKNTIYVDGSDLDGYFEEHNQLCRAFGKAKDQLEIPADLRSLLEEHIEDRKERSKVFEAKRSLKKAEKRAESYLEDKKDFEEEMAEKAENLKRWLRGDSISTWQLDTPENLDLLRVKGQKIETSGGSEVSLRAGLLLLAEIENRTAKIGQKIGPFEVSEIDGDIIEIGCHRISLGHAQEVLAKYR